MGIAKRYADWQRRSEPIENFASRYARHLDQQQAHDLRTARAESLEKALADGDAKSVFNHMKLEASLKAQREEDRRWVLYSLLAIACLVIAALLIHLL